MVNIGDIRQGLRPEGQEAAHHGHAHAPLVAEEADKLFDNDTIVRDAIEMVENNGIVFLTIDKICARNERRWRRCFARRRPARSLR
jgi:ATP-dependent protease HslVU (ClpYQ) ATPase subunit